MKTIKCLVAALMLLGVTSQALAWNIKVYNKTPFSIQVKAKSWGGLLHGDWVTIPVGKVGNAGPRGADCIDGMWVQVDIPGKGYTEIGYFNFKFAPMSPCSDTTAVVGVEPILSTEMTTQQVRLVGIGTIGAMQFVLKQFKFFVAHVHGDVDSAAPNMDVIFSK
jgi:hypothetical protein